MVCGIGIDLLVSTIAVHPYSPGHKCVLESIPVRFPPPASLPPPRFSFLCFPLDVDIHLEEDEKAEKEATQSIKDTPQRW